MNRKCAICGKSHDLFELRFEANETDAEEEWSQYVCGSCWETIAAIARRVARIVLDEAVANGGLK